MTCRLTSEDMMWGVPSSTEAHKVLAQAGLATSSYGTGSQVKIPAWPYSSALVVTSHLSIIALLPSILSSWHLSIPVKPRLQVCCPSWHLGIFEL